MTRLQICYILNVSNPISTSGTAVIVVKIDKHLNLPDVSKKYPLLAGNRNETIRHYYFPSEQLNLSIFNVDSHALQLKIFHQTPEIQAYKDKLYSTPETRGFEKGHDLYH